jgi:glucosamine--fructose-6-phosphate aminotransferase (isomerizing)
MKHGQLLLIDEHMPVVVIAQGKAIMIRVIYKRLSLEVEELLVTKGDTQVRELADFVIEIPETSDALSPLITTIPLQLLSII